MKSINNTDTLRVPNKIKITNMNGFWYKGKLKLVGQTLNT